MSPAERLAGAGERPIVFIRKRHGDYLNVVIVNYSAGVVGAKFDPLHPMAIEELKIVGSHLQHVFRR